METRPSNQEAPIEAPIIEGAETQGIAATKEVEPSLNELIKIMDFLENCSATIGDPLLAEILPACQGKHPAAIAHYLLVKLTPEQLAKLNQEMNSSKQDAQN